MKLGELGSSILDIHDECVQLGMSDSDIQQLEIMDEIKFVFANQIVQSKHFQLRLQQVTGGYVILKREE